MFAPKKPVVRMGGDEFLITLFDTASRTTKRSRIGSRRQVEERGPVSFSLGWATREEKRDAGRNSQPGRPAADPSARSGTPARSLYAEAPPELQAGSA